MRRGGARRRRCRFAPDTDRYRNRGSRRNRGYSGPDEETRRIRRSRRTRRTRRGRRSRRGRDEGSATVVLAVQPVYPEHADRRDQADSSGYGQPPPRSRRHPELMPWLLADLVHPRHRFPDSAGLPLRRTRCLNGAAGAASGDCGFPRSLLSRGLPVPRAAVLASRRGLKGEDRQWSTGRHR